MCGSAALVFEVADRSARRARRHARRRSAWPRCSIRRLSAPQLNRNALIGLALSVAGTLLVLLRQHDLAAPAAARPADIRINRLRDAVRRHGARAVRRSARPRLRHGADRTLSRRDSIYLALIGSVLAFACYLTCSGRIGADRAAYVTVLVPVVALAVSTVVRRISLDARPPGSGWSRCLPAIVLVLRPAKAVARCLVLIPPPARLLRQVVERGDDVLGERVGERGAFMRIAHQADAAERQFGKSVGGREHAHARAASPIPASPRPRDPDSTAAA